MTSKELFEKVLDRSEIPARERSAYRHRFDQAQILEQKQAVEKARGALPATRKQLNYLKIRVAKIEEKAGKPVDELTREEASEWITRLSGSAA